MNHAHAKRQKILNEEVVYEQSKTVSIQSTRCMLQTAVVLGDAIWPLVRLSVIYNRSIDRYFFLKRKQILGSEGKIWHSSIFCFRSQISHNLELLPILFVAHPRRIKFDQNVSVNCLVVVNFSHFCLLPHNHCANIMLFKHIFSMFKP